MITELCGLNINRTFILKILCSIAFICFFDNASAVILLMQNDPLTVLSVQALATCFAYLLCIRDQGCFNIKACVLCACSCPSRSLLHVFSLILEY